MYIIAQEIRFSNWKELNHFVIKKVGFHIMVLYWKIFGKGSAESGLDELLIEAGVFGQNATSMIMQDKHYKQCTLPYKLIFEVMCWLQWQDFSNGILQQGRKQQQDSEKIEQHCLKVQEKMKAVSQKRELTEEDQQKFMNAFEILCKTYSTTTYPDLVQ